MIISIVHSAAVLIVVVSVSAAGKGTEVAIRLHNSKRGSMVNSEFSLARWSARTGKGPPTSRMSGSSTGSDAPVESVRVAVSPTPSVIHEWVPQPSVLPVLNRVLAPVGLEASSLPVGEGEWCPSRTSNSGLAEDSHSEV